MIVRDSRSPEGRDEGPFPAVRSNRVSGGRIEPKRPTPPKVIQAAYIARLRAKEASNRATDPA